MYNFKLNFENGHLTRLCKVSVKGSVKEASDSCISSVSRVSSTFLVFYCTRIRMVQRFPLLHITVRSSANNSALTGFVTMFNTSFIATSNRNTFSKTIVEKNITN